MRIISVSAFRTLLILLTLVEEINPGDAKREFKPKQVLPGTNKWPINHLFISSRISQSNETIYISASIQHRDGSWHVVAATKKHPNEHNWIIKADDESKCTFTKDGFFEIRNVSSADDGTKLKFTIEGLLEKNSPVLIRLEYTAPPELTGPEIIRQSPPSPITATEGEHITLHCKAHGNPPPNISWAKIGNESVLHRGENYTISNISRELEGEYFCTASNGIGVNATAAFTMIVYYEPCIQSGPDHQIVLEGSSIFFEVIVTGSPKPNITWTDAGGKVIGEGEVLHLPKVKREATSMYKVTAHNGVGKATSATVNLIVISGDHLKTRIWNLDWGSFFIGVAIALVVIRFRHFILYWPCTHLGLWLKRNCIRYNCDHLNHQQESVDEPNREGSVALVTLDVDCDEQETDSPSGEHGGVPPGVPENAEDQDVMPGIQLDIE